MKYRSRLTAWMLLLFACLLPAFSQNRDSGSAKLGSQTHSQTQSETPKGQVNLHFKNGTRVSGDLVQNDPANSDAILIDIGGLRRSVELTELIGITENPSKFDEYHSEPFNAEKARLDTFANALHNNPGASAYLIGYGQNLCEGRARVDRAREYLVYTRGLDASRVVTVSNGCQNELMVQLWIVPLGAAQPPTEQTVSCRKCPSPPAAKRGSRRRPHK